MADFKELYTSDDFLAYQDKVTDCMVGWLHEAIFVDHRHPSEIKSAVEIFEKIIAIPSETFDTGEIGKRFRARVKSRLIEIPSALLRKEMFSDQQ